MRWQCFAILLVALGSATNAQGQQTTADSLKASFWTHALAGAEAGDSCLLRVDPEEELRKTVACPELRAGFERAQEPARLLKECCAEAAFVTDRRIPIEDAAASLLELERRVSQELAAGRAPSLENHMLLIANLRHIMIEAWSALRDRQ